MKFIVSKNWIPVYFASGYNFGHADFLKFEIIINFNILGGNQTEFGRVNFLAFVPCGTLNNFNLLSV